MKTITKKTPQALLEDTGYNLFVDSAVLVDAPRGLSKEPVETFTIGEYVTDEELEKEYESRGLVPATLDELISVEDSHDFITTHWKDAANKWCHAAFRRWDGGRGVYVSRYDYDWSDCWWFCGTRKVPFNRPQPINADEEALGDRLENYEEDDSGCWNWNGVVSKGYGLIKVHSRSVRVHRLMYEVFVGPIPEGLVIDHLCKNKQCVNPEHLEAVTSRENTLRGEGPSSRKAHGL